MNEEIKKEITIGTKLRVAETIKKTAYVYQTGFNQFMILAAISSATYIGFAAAEVVLPFAFLIGMLLMVMSFVSFYFYFRSTVSTIFLTGGILQGKKPTFRETFQQSNGFAGTYFVVSLAFGCIVALPGIGIAFSYEFITNYALKFGVIGLLLIPFSFLFTRYYLAIPSAILSGRESGDFEKSKLLVKGDFWQVFFVIVLTYGATMGIEQILNMVVGICTEWWLLVIAIVLNFAFWFLSFPISNIASAIMYLELNSRKNVDVYDDKAVRPNESIAIINLNEGQNPDQN